MSARNDANETIDSSETKRRLMFGACIVSIVILFAHAISSDALIKGELDNRRDDNGSGNHTRYLLDLQINSQITLIIDFSFLVSIQLIGLYGAYCENTLFMIVYVAMQSIGTIYSSHNAAIRGNSGYVSAAISIFVTGIAVIYLADLIVRHRNRDSGRHHCSRGVTKVVVDDFSGPKILHHKQAFPRSAWTADSAAISTDEKIDIFAI